LKTTENISIPLLPKIEILLRARARAKKTKEYKSNKNKDIKNITNQLTWKPSKPVFRPPSR